MPNGRFEPHLWWFVRVVFWEAESCAEEAAAVEFAVVGDHEHDLPFVDVVVDEADRDVGEGFVGLHLF